MARRDPYERLELDDADLKGVDLRNAPLSPANLRGADLRGADLRNATLDEANLEGALLANVRVNGADWLEDLCGGLHPPAGRDELRARWQVETRRVPNGETEFRLQLRAPRARHRLPTTAPAPGG